MKLLIKQNRREMCYNTGITPHPEKTSQTVWAGLHIYQQTTVNIHAKNRGRQMGSPSTQEMDGGDLLVLVLVRTL